MQLYPVFLSLAGRKCLVVGDNSKAQTRALELRNAGAAVTIAAGELLPDLPDSIEQIITDGAGDLSGTRIRNFCLVVAASEDGTINESLARVCAEQNTFCSVEGKPKTGSCYLPTSATSPQTASKGASGTVSLVGAGPGDPDLLTVRALRLIQTADVLVYDRLVSDAILDLRSADTELIYAGKAMANHTMPQESINQLLVKHARQGQHVVRLKGGDPFIFGRGGEEIETLSDEGVPFQVVPGITAASGCSAFSGIPLTHRDYAQSCTFVTGHLQNGNINLNWENLREPDQTVVVYMGLTGLPQICKKLIEIGRAQTTPAALIEQGTTPNQRVFSATLGTLATTVAENDVRAPTLLVIGSVVSLREKLNWYHANT